MKNLKRLTILFAILVLGIILIPNTVNGAVEYTRNIYSNNGSMKFNFTGLELDENHEYEFGLTKTKAATVEKWFLITEYTNTTATIDVMTTTEALRNVINAVDTGYITIKDKTEDIVVLEPTGVDLKTPFLRLSSYTVIENGTDLSNNYIQIASISKSGYGSAYFQYEKITDTSIINKYKEIKSNNGDFLQLESMLAQSVPTSNWQKWGFWSGAYADGYTQRTIETPDEGLYYMWLYFSGSEIKNVYGYILVDGFKQDNQAPTVKEIHVESPASGTYKTPQTVKIRVSFSEKITGTTVPTLKIKFGDSPERTLTNGTIITDTYGNQIKYAYNIQDTDVGQLVTVSLTGGNITDEAGNAAILSFPLITGNMIKANVDGTNTNNTDNQNTNTNTTTEELTAIITYSTTAETTGSVTATIKTNKKIKEVTGWTISSDGKTLTKTYTKNTTETVKLVDYDNKTKDVQIKIANIKATSTPTPSKTTPTPTPKGTDSTTMKGKIPQTGESYTIALISIITIAISAILYIRYKKMKDIK